MSFEQRFNQMLKTGLEEKKYKGILSELYKSTMLTALLNSSCQTLGCEVKELEELYKIATNKKEMNFYQFAQINNTMQTLTAIQLRLSFENYIELMSEGARLANAWNVLVKPITDKINDTLQAELKNAVQKPNGNQSLDSLEDDIKLPTFGTIKGNA